MKDFIFKPFSEMTDEDYKFVGFMSGLEIHQQLMTKKKLFCRCPAGMYNHHYDAEILRHMRPTLSELGEYDGTALMEFKTKKEIIYQINRESVCTYEMDDTPPFEINDDALDIAIEIGMLYNSATIDEIHIARKQYLDGSIPTGFQRTAIVSVGGQIPYKDRQINIIQLSIEEDSCREISDTGHRRVYVADRLGMPLIETVTAPDMKTPEEVAEVCKILSNIVKSTGKVRTGAGAAREDVNVSVEGGTRIEIKGVPSIKRIPLLTYNEAMRQWNLLRLREELGKRGITTETFASKTDDVTRILRKALYQPIANAISEEKSVYAVTLRRFKGLLNWKTQTETYFSKEISDRVRVIACLTTLPNIIHSDSTSETISIAEWQKVKKTVGATEEDTVVITWGNAIDANTSAKEIIIRAKEATIGIPSETRQAQKDGTTGFERILPGADRMYPDTDLPPKRIPAGRKNIIRSGLHEPIWEREKWYKSLGIPADVMEPLAISKNAALFKKAVNELGINPILAAVALIQYPKRLKKMKADPEQLNEEIFLGIFRAFNLGLISREGIIRAMFDATKYGSFELEHLAPTVDENSLEKIIQSSISEVKKMKLFNDNNFEKVLTGNVMNKVRGRIDGKLVIKFIKKISGENKK
ncbi:MAG: Glu-tRNA(Gln) amidotransferase subunit GatE [Ignavibacteriae bacterium]|nr:Glu-tRNA(Gln) amidotransferase subunit GatE [Ignavibacteriota bacterium]